MRTVPAAITAARATPTSRLCKIWRLERTDGTVLRFTEHDRELEVDGETFLPTASFDPSTIKASGDLAVDDLDVQGAFDSSLITAEDLMAGRYHGATFYVAEVLWDNPGAGKDVLRFGWLGRVREAGGRFVAELLGPTVKLQQPLLELYSPGCRATLGDARCGVDLGPLTQVGTVTTVYDRRAFDASGLTLLDPEYFHFGKVAWTSGANAGLEMEVQGSDGTLVALFLPMPFPVEAGDTFDIVPGCNKALGTCRDKFDNVLNFRGHPHVPVSDDLIKGPGGQEEPRVTVPDPNDGTILGPGGGGGQSPAIPDIWVPGSARPFSDNSPWNAPVPLSASYVDNAESQKLRSGDRGAFGVNRANWSIAVGAATGSTALINVLVHNIYGSHPDAVVKVPWPPGLTPTGGSDRHVSIYDPDGLTVHEMWYVYGTYPNFTCSAYCRTKLAGTGWNLFIGGVLQPVNTHSGFGAPRAVSVSALGGLIRAGEITSGTLNHALAFAVPFHWLKGDGPRVPPANPVTYRDGTSVSNGPIPYSRRFAIPRSVNIPGMGLDPAYETFGLALQEHGGYPVDVSSNPCFYAAHPEASADAAALNADSSQMNALIAQMRVVQ